MTSLSQTWGTTPEERQLPFPCDRFIQKPDAAVYRGVTIHAPREIIFRWLCQMRVAPYSYDWIDNCGRQSPRELIPGLDVLEIGQEVMGIFNLVDFSLSRHLTIRIKPDTRASRIFGDVAGSYLVVVKDATTCRLLVKLIVQYPRGVIGRSLSSFFPWGDFVMMRRQLLNFKELAELTPNEAIKETIL
jgi:hypothetical protein